MKHASKKHIDDLKAYETEFMKLAKKINMDKDVAKRIFKMIVDSGLYSFNESHAIAYAILCYISAYLKVYYPREFLAASLTNAYERKEDVVDLVNECRRLGYQFLLPDINISDWDFTLEDTNKIRIGMCAIKSFGEKAFVEISNKRPFTSLQDFIDKITKKDCTKRSIVPAILTGCFSEFNYDRLEVYEEYYDILDAEPVLELTIQGKKEKLDLSRATYADIESTYFGVALISDPVNNFKPIGLDNIKQKQFNILGVFDRIKKLKDKNGNQMAFVTLSTGDGLIEAVIFANQYSKYKSYLKKNTICKVNLKKSNDDYIINSIELSAA